MLGFGKSKRARATEINNRAAALAEAGRPAEAISLQTNAIALAPDWALLHHNRGYSHLLLKDYQSAFTDFDTAVKLEPGYLVARKRRAICRFRLRDHLGAIDDLNIVIAEKPDDPESRQIRGMAHMRSGTGERGIDDFQCLVDWGGGYITYVNLAQCLADANRHEEAIERYRYAASLEPDQHGHHWWLGSSLEETGQLEQALEEYNLAATQDTMNIMGASQIRVLKKLGRTAEAAGIRKAVDARRDAHVRSIAQTGKFAWAAVIQAQNLLHEPGETDGGSKVVFTLQRDVPDLGGRLFEAARAVADHKFRPGTDAASMVLNEMVTDEQGSEGFRRPVPPSIAGDVPMTCAYLLIHRGYLPNGLLDVPFLPIAVQTEEGGQIVHLPWSVGLKKKAMLGENA